MNRNVPDVLLSATRRGGSNYPWPGEVLGSCTALRSNRVAASILYLPVIALDVMKFPGTQWLLRRWSPVGQLAYGRDVASLGFQCDTVRGSRVQLDWTERSVAASVVSRGWLFDQLAVNDRVVRVDKRCSDALVTLWRS